MPKVSTVCMSAALPETLQENRCPDQLLRAMTTAVMPDKPAQALLPAAAGAAAATAGPPAEAAAGPPGARRGMLLLPLARQLGSPYSRPVQGLPSAHLLTPAVHHVASHHLREHPVCRTGTSLVKPCSLPAMGGVPCARHAAHTTAAALYICLCGLRDTGILILNRKRSLNSFDTASQTFSQVPQSTHGTSGHAQGHSQT